MSRHILWIHIKATYVADPSPDTANLQFGDMLKTRVGPANDTRVSPSSALHMCITSFTSRDMILSLSLNMKTFRIGLSCS